jgi:hypothetical protein
MLRLGRHRWATSYWTPLQAGLFLAGDDFEEVISARIQTEGGAIFPVGGAALEAGLAAGPGILAVTYASGCDGPCNLGGGGLVLSPVLRYLFRASAPFALGAVLRADIPTYLWSDNCFNVCSGRAVLVLAGLEAALHWPGFGR